MPSNILQEPGFKVAAPIQIRMSDLDPFVHVNNGNQCHYFDLGRSFYLEKVLQDQVDWTTIDLVLVHIELDFLSPIEFHDSIVCETRISRIGNKSLQMQQQLRDTKTNIVKTKCYSVLAGFDRVSHKSKPIKEEYKRHILEFENLADDKQE